ncbi:MAG TPA: hypothetical protein VHX38_02635 [Pseudonocardiaceae bacterium]|jgi:hypothetical protein|nr:hypothetical protein [Pseudonocardiaceae bacterium]
MTTATRKKAKPSEPAVVPDSDVDETVPPVQTAGLVPLQLDTSQDTDPRFTTREPLFFIDGNAYTIPLAFPGSITLEFNYLAARAGTEAAIDFAFSAGLGERSYRDLRKVRNLTDQQMHWIRDQILARILRRTDPKA